MIPVAFITDENFIMQTSVAITSLSISKNEDTEYLVYIIMAECSERSEKTLLSLGEKLSGINIVIKRTGLDAYRDIKQLAHIPISCLLKFDLCELVTEEDKLIYLDGDILVRKDLSDFYDIPLGDNFFAGVPSLDLIFTENDRLVNAGILLFDARKMRENGMRDILVAKRRELGNSGSMDQQTYNLVMKDKMGYLPWEYNFAPGKVLGSERASYTIEKLNALYNTSYRTGEDMAKDAAIWHFCTGDKPWKYSFIYGADEWYECYRLSPFGGEKLKRKNALQAHAAGAINHLRNGGVKALFARADQLVKRRRGKEEHKAWG